MTETTVLLVEDDEPMRASCAKALRGAAYRVVEAPSPVEAADALAREEIDVVVTDIRMPAGGGEEVLRLVRRTAPDLPVLFITAYPSVPSAVEAIRGGAVDYLLKPFTGGDLVAAIERGISARAERDLSDLLRRVGAPRAGSSAPDVGGLDAVLARFERAYVEDALARNDRNVSRTAKALGIHRVTLQRLMRRFEIPSPWRSPPTAA